MLQVGLGEDVAFRNSCSPQLVTEPPTRWSMSGRVRGST